MTHFAASFVYIESEIPEGMTLREWRRRRHEGDRRRSRRGLWRLVA